MQALIILNTIISIAILIIAIYSIWLFSKLNNFGKDNLDKQTEYLIRHSKQFLIFAIISSILFVCDIVGFCILVNFDIEILDNPMMVVVLLAMFISIVPLITFFCGYLLPKWRNRNKKPSSPTQHQFDYNATKVSCVSNDEDLRKKITSDYKSQEPTSADNLITVEKLSHLRQQLAKERQDRERNHSLLYFQENSPTLIKKYTQSVRNFIKKMVEDISGVFLSMFKDSKIPLSSILVYPYRNTNSQLLRDKIKWDGLEFTFSDNEELNNKIQKLTEFFITGLKKRIKDNNEWQDNITFPALLYVIVRNNVIKYYHDEYLKYFGYENIEEFCEKIPNGITDAENTVPVISELNIFSKKLASNAKTYFVYYYIYETDINLPFVDTYSTICEEIDKIYENLKTQKLENDLFGNPRNNSVQVEQTTDNIKSTTIERVDTMSGAEFELFMTQYFKSQGFKTTHTPISGDYGIDLIIENDFSKIGVQAKCYSNKVSLNAVQQVVAGLRHYGLSSGIVITNNYFQPSAIRLAADNNITLWDRDKLIEKLRE